MSNVWFGLGGLGKDTPALFDPPTIGKLCYTNDYLVQPTKRGDGCFDCDDDRTSLNDGDLQL